MNSKLHIVQRSVRNCFYRGETATLNFNLANFFPENIKNAKFIAELDSKKITEIEYPVIGPFCTSAEVTIDTASINSGRYQLTLSVISDNKVLSNLEIPFNVAPPRRQNGMHLWHWPATVHYSALELSVESGKEQLKLLASMGFDWVQFRGNWAIRNFAHTVELIEEAMMLGIELGILIENSNGGQFRHLASDPEDARLITKDGIDPLLANAYHADIEHRNRSFIEQLLTLFGEFPACTTLFLNSEIEDKLKLPFDPQSKERHLQELGFSVDKVTSIDRIFCQKLPPPESGVIADDDIEYLYAKYYFKKGDGFVHTNEIMAQTAYRMRPDIITISDPIRNCSIHHRFKNLSCSSSWTYTNPDPKATLFTETLIREATPEQQLVIPTITHWNYAGTLAPCGADRFAREQTLRMGPDRYKECAWLNFSRGVKAIGNYFGSPIEPTLRDGDPFIYSPKTEEAIGEFATQVMRPFGELAQKATAKPRKIAILDSFASRVYGSSPAPYNHYPNYTVYNFYTIVNMAHLEADIIFDEDVRSEFLSQYEILILPNCDVLTQSIYNTVVNFEKQGGKVVVDQYFRANIPNAIRFDFDFEYRKQVNANANINNADFAVKDDTHFRKEWGGKVETRGVTAEEDQKIIEEYTAQFRAIIDNCTTSRQIDCSTPKLLLHQREHGDSSYLFITNDNRTWDDRVGKYLSMLEQGVATTGSIKIRVPNLNYTIYELISKQKIEYTREGDYIVFNITIAPASGAIIALYPNSPQPMYLKENTLYGGYTNGIQPVKLRWTQGEKESDYSNFYTIIDGKLELPNRHENGDWQLEVTDLCSGEIIFF